MFSSLKVQTNNILKLSNIVASVSIIIIFIKPSLVGKSHRLAQGSKTWINYEMFLHQLPVSVIFWCSRAADGQKEWTRSMKWSIADCGPSCTSPPSPVLLTHSSSSAVQQITLTLTHTRKIKARPRAVVTSAAARVKAVTQKEELPVLNTFKWLLNT